MAGRIYKSACIQMNNLETESVELISRWAVYVMRVGVMNSGA